MKKSSKIKKVTVSGNWINEIFIGDEKEVFKFLTDIKKRQFEMLSESLQASYKKAHGRGGSPLPFGRGGRLHVESVRDDIHKKHPDIGIKIKIEDHNLIEKNFF